MCIFKGDLFMIKNTFMFVFGVCFLGIITNTEAIVAQSASKAMSYQNTVRSSSIKKTSIGNKEKKQEVLPYKLTTVDLRNVASKNIVLIEHEELEIKVKEIEGYTWKVSYESGSLMMIGNSAEDGIRTIKFKQKGTNDSSVFLDKRDASGKTIENKAVYIKVN